MQTPTWMQTPLDADPPGCRHPVCRHPLDTDPSPDADPPGCRPPPPREQTYAYDNIALHQTLIAGGKNRLEVVASGITLYTNFN